MAEPEESRAGANAEQAAEWDGPAGAHRIRYAAVFDAEDRPHNERFRAATGVAPADHVLDVGCGTGQSTRDAARDAQVHAFPAGGFDVAISRFGSMFFADPVAAFGNIARALRPGGRLVLMVWQARERNAWSTAIRDAIAGDAEVPPPPAAGPHPFSLGDPEVARGILAAAGFTEVGFADVREPLYYGPDAAVAFGVVRGLRSTRDLLAGMDAPAAERALGRLRVILAAHQTSGGVLFDARTWIITGRRA